jgi:hypothetical protein
MVAPMAWVCGDAAPRVELPSVTAATSPLSTDGLPFRYHRIGETGARAYELLPDVSEGKVAAELEPDFIVAISRTARWEDRDFGLTSKNTWIALEELAPLGSSRFAGSEVTGELSSVAWVRRDRCSFHDAPGGRRIGSLARHAELRVLGARQRGKIDWLDIGEGRWVRADDLRRPTPAIPPAELRPNERWIDVDLQHQVLTAYEGTRAVFTTLVSTGKGRDDSPLATPKGEHRIWVKLRTTDMSNLEDEDAQRYYAIQDVPWVMFFKAGYGLHGAFWHDSFGEVRSHGCVNLAPRDAERLFHWVSPRLPAGWSAVLPTAHDLGTRVVVR